MARSKGKRTRGAVQEQFSEQFAALQTKLLASYFESVDLSASYVDPSDRFSGPNGERWLPIGANQDGRSFADTSNFKSEQELTEARDYCRLLARCNPFAINLHENMVNYAVGSGLKCTIVARKNEAVEGDTLREVQSLVDDWFFDNKWGAVQQEAAVRYDRDGEFFHRFFKGEDGELRVRFVEPNHIYQPKFSVKPSSQFGVETDPDDVGTVLGYWIDNGKSHELVDAEEIQHVKANVDSTVRRGCPTTWPIGRLLERAVHVLHNIGKVSLIQTKIALIRRHLGATKAGIQAMRALASDFTSQNPRTGKTDYIQSLPDGAIIDTNGNTEYDYPAGGIDVEKFGLGVQAILRGAAARICFPEFMFTSDASNASYSSTMMAEGPAVRMFERRQEVHKSADLEVIWRVLEYYAEQGRIPADLLERIEVQLEAPSVAVRDGLGEAQENKILCDSKVLSIQTWRAKAGLDGEQEEKNIGEYEKLHPPVVPPPPFGNIPPTMEARLAAFRAGANLLG